MGTYGLLRSSIPDQGFQSESFSETTARTNFAVGILMLLPILGSLVLLGTHRPLLMGLGWILLLSTFSVGAIGAAGLGYLASDQIRRMAPEIEAYPAFLRGTGFLVTACMLPILGWFVFTPCILLASFGGGLRSLVGKSGVRAPAIVDPSAV